MVFLTCAGDGVMPICGSIVPPIAIVPGEHVVFELDPFGRVDVAFTR